jgi:hypothetical protein
VRLGGKGFHCNLDELATALNTGQSAHQRPRAFSSPAGQRAQRLFDAKPNIVAENLQVGQCLDDSVDSRSLEGAAFSGLARAPQAQKKSPSARLGLNPPKEEGGGDKLDVTATDPFRTAPARQANLNHGHRNYRKFLNTLTTETMVPVYFVRCKRLL